MCAAMLSTRANALGSGRSQKEISWGVDGLEGLGSSDRRERWFSPRFFFLRRLLGERRFFRCVFCA